MNKKLMMLVPVLFLLSGCATYYNVRMNGYLAKIDAQQAIARGVSFYVMDNKNAKNPIFDNEVKFKIEKALIQKWYKTGSFENADYFISFTYGISSGRIVSETMPVYYPGDTGTIQTYSSTGRTTTSFITFPGYTSYVPYRVTVYTSSLYIKVIDAFSFRKDKQEKLIWIGESFTTAQNSDLRDTVNYLLVACFAHFGENTGRSIVSNLRENDVRLREFY